jgi:hypothetical protein
MVQFAIGELRDNRQAAAGRPDEAASGAAMEMF